MKQSLPFHHPYRHDFVRVAVAVPRIKVADPAYNAEQTIAMLEQAAAAGASLVALPELGLSAYTCDDLFHQRALLDGCEAALAPRRRGDARIPVTAIVGLPLRVDDLLFNCAAVVSRRQAARRRAQDLPAELPRVLRSAPVQPRPTTRAVARGRRSPARRAVRHRPALHAPRTSRCCTLHVEICEDLWVPIPPSSLAALAGRDGARQPVGVEHHDRQGRLPAPARRPAVGALPGRLPLHLGGRRRIDHRPGLGRPGADLRERQAARRVRALRQRRRTSSSPTSTSSASRASACARPASASRSAASRRVLEGFRSVAFELPVPRGDAARRCGARSSASRTCRPIRRGATSAAPRSTTSRCRRWCSACRRPASTRW